MQSGIVVKRSGVITLSKERETDPQIVLLGEKIRKSLTFDLVKKKYRGPTPIHGSCYIASEAIYHILNGNNDPELKIKRVKMPNGVNHWWIEKSGKVIDLTYDQFDIDVPYEKGIGGTFLTKEPSSRCKSLLEKLKD